MPTIPVAALALVAAALPSTAIWTPHAPPTSGVVVAAVDDAADTPVTAGPESNRLAGASLAAAMAEMSRDSRLEIRLSDAPPMDVEFVRYDAEREVLIYRQRTSHAIRDEVGEVRRDRIEEIRPYELGSSGGTGGMLLGLLAGAAIGVAVGSASDDFDTGVAELAGGLGGMCVGSVLGYIVGSAAGSKKHRGPVVWERLNR